MQINPTTVYKILATALAYFLVARFSLFLSIPPGYATAIWPAAGLAVAAVITAGPIISLGVLIGSFAVNLYISLALAGVELSGMAILIALGIAVGSTLQAVAAFYLVAKNKNKNGFLLWDSRALFRLIFLGGPLSCLMSASGGNLVLISVGIIDKEQLLWSWFTWWAGDSLGVFVFAPLLLLLLERKELFNLRSKLLAAIPFLSLLTGLAFFYQSTVTTIRTELSSTLEENLQSLTQSLRFHVEGYESNLMALQAFFLSSEFVSREEFAQFATIALANQDFIQALEWIPAVPHSERKEWETEAPGVIAPFSIQQRKNEVMQTRESSDLYYPIYYMEPHLGNESSLGFDLYSDPEIRKVIDRALSSGLVVASAPGKRLQSESSTLSFSLLLAVDPNTRGDLVAGVFKTQPVFTSLTQAMATNVWHFEVVDEESDRLIFRWPEGSHFEDDQMFSRSHEFFVGQRVWQVRSQLNNQFIYQFFLDRLWPLITVSMTLVGLLVTYVISLAYRSVSVEQEVVSRTEELNDQTRFLTSILDSLPLMVFVKDAKTLTLLQLNKYGERLTGLSREQYFNKSDLDFFPEEEAKAFMEKDREVLQGNAVYDVPVEVLTTENGVRYLHTRKITVRDADGDPMLLVGMSEDITQQLQQEKQLKEKQANLEAISNAFEDLYFWLDSEGIIEDCRINQQLSSMSEELIIGKPLSEVLPDHFTPEFEAAMASMNGVPVSLDYEINLINGESNFFEARIASIHDKQKLVIIRDISERKRIERQLMLANQYKSDFLANMSHEIRTPMNAVLGLTQLVLNTSLEPYQQDYLKKIQYSSRSLLNILNDILDYSKIEANKLSLHVAPFELDELLYSLSGLFSIQADEKGINLVFNPDIGLSKRYQGDVLRLNQILSNLLSNAIKFTESGSVCLSIHEKALTDDRCELIMEVADTGIGIPDDVQALLFQPFSQADASITRKFGGTGLGLAICKRLTDLMGGKIEVFSSPSSGTRFVVSVPLEVLSSELSPQEEELSPVKVLLVEENILESVSIKKQLEAWHFDVVHAHTSLEALGELEFAQQAGQPFEWIFISRHLPEVDGIELADIVRSRNDLNGLKVIMIVTPMERDNPSTGVVSDAFIETPIVPSKLKDVLLRFQKGEDVRKPSSELPIEVLQALAQPIRGTHILLAEDNPMNQLVVTDLLHQIGLKITVVENGLKAVEIAQKEHFDLILMDLQMPEMDGFEATQAIKAQLKNDTPPILAMTAAAMLTDREAALSAGMCGHVSKPVDFGELVNQLLYWISRPKTNQSEPEKIPLKQLNPEEIHIEGLDLNNAVLRIGGQWALLKRMLESFIKEFGHADHQLVELVDNGDWQSAVRLVHSLKGVAGSVGADDLGYQAAELERSLKDQSLHQLDAFLEQLRETINKVRDYLGA